MHQLWADARRGLDQLLACLVDNVQWLGRVSVQCLVFAGICAGTARRAVATATVWIRGTLGCIPGRPAIKDVKSKPARHCLGGRAGS